MERFQATLHRTLTKEAERDKVWLWHPPDGMGLWRPGDWLFGAGSIWGCIEAKQSRTDTLPLSQWKPQQIQACRHITDAGGIYWLVICFGFETPQMVVVAYIGGIALQIIDAYGNFDHRRDLQRQRFQYGMRVLFWNKTYWENAYALFNRPQRDVANWRQKV